MELNAGWLSRFILAKWIVEPAFRVRAEEQGVLMTHAAALSDGEHAVLVSGHGGAGKTTWALQWLDSGKPYLSDDFSFIMGGKVHPYITPMRIGLKNILINPVLQNMPLSAKIETAVRTALRRATLGRAKFYYKAPVTRLIPGVKISKEVDMMGAIYLDPALKPSDPPRPMGPSDMAATMRDVDLAELHGFGPQSLRDRFAQTHLTLLEKLLAGKPCLRLSPLAFPPPPALSSIGNLLHGLGRV